MRKLLIRLSKFFYRRPEISFNRTTLNMLISSGVLRLANHYRGSYGELRDDQ